MSLCSCFYEFFVFFIKKFVFIERYGRTFVRELFDLSSDGKTLKFYSQCTRVPIALGLIRFFFGKFKAKYRLTTPGVGLFGIFIASLKRKLF